RRAHGPPRGAARAPGAARRRDGHPLPDADPPPAGLGRGLRGAPDAAARRAGRARDPLPSGARRPDRRRGGARRGDRRALLRLMPAEEAPALSIVVPVYNEEGNVGPLHAELTAVARGIGGSYELLFVNDGSTDQTLPRLLALADADPCLRVVELDGNFGE